jgi:ketosteroid isomerase-like protein
MKMIFLLVASIMIYHSTESQTNSIGFEKAKRSIEKVIQQVSADFHNGDSVAIAGHYATNATFGSVRGRDKITEAWGSFIRSCKAKGYTNVVYHTNAMATDGEYVAELGDYDITDMSNNVQIHGKYMVVWKQEDGDWKLYRDMGL